MAELLLSNGINVDLKNEKGKTALDVAKEQGESRNIFHPITLLQLVILISGQSELVALLQKAEKIK